MNRKEIEAVVVFCFHHQYTMDFRTEKTKYEVYDRYSEFLKCSREHVDWKVKFYTDEFIRVNDNGTTD